MNNNYELRFVTALKSTTESRTITGSAIVFDLNSTLLDGKFYEKISSKAVTEDFIRSQDIFVYYNHTPNNGILARSKNGEGSLKITVTPTSVDYSFDAPDSAIGNQVLESVRRGDLSSSSFSFRVAQGGDVWERRSDGTAQRTINRFEQIGEFSLVPVPAYDAATVSTRGLDELKELEEKEKVALDELVKKEKELAEYYTTYDNMIKDLTK